MADRVLAAPHEHPWAEDHEGRCVLCGLGVQRDRIEAHMRGMARRIDELTDAIELVVDELGDPDVIDIRLGTPEGTAIRKLHEAYGASTSAERTVVPEVPDQHCPRCASEHVTLIEQPRTSYFCASCAEVFDVETDPARSDASDAGVWKCDCGKQRIDRSRLRETFPIQVVCRCGSALMPSAPGATGAEMESEPVPATLSTPEFPDALTRGDSPKTASDQRVQKSGLVEWEGPQDEGGSDEGGAGDAQVLREDGPVADTVDGRVPDVRPGGAPAGLRGGRDGNRGEAREGGRVREASLDEIGHAYEELPHAPGDSQLIAHLINVHREPHTGYTDDELTLVHWSRHAAVEPGAECGYEWGSPLTHDAHACKLLGSHKNHVCVVCTASPAPDETTAECDHNARHDLLCSKCATCLATTTPTAPDVPADQANYSSDAELRLMVDAEEMKKGPSADAPTRDLISRMEDEPTTCSECGAPGHMRWSNSSADWFFERSATEAPGEREKELHANWQAIYEELRDRHDKMRAVLLNMDDALLTWKNSGDEGAAEFFHEVWTPSVKEVLISRPHPATPTVTPDAASPEGMTK